MKEKKLRGQMVVLDSSNKKLIVSIHKPMGSVFSLSDKIVEYKRTGYEIVVNLPDRAISLTSKDKPFKIEEVKSKFAGYPPWYRYWFPIKPEVKERQLTFL